MANDFEVKVAWLGTLLGNATVEEFEKYFLEELGFHIKYEEEFTITDGFYKDLNCIIFGICSKEIPKFSIFRITTTDMKWLEDLYSNEKEGIPSNIVKKYNLDEYDMIEEGVV